MRVFLPDLFQYFYTYIVFFLLRIAEQRAHIPSTQRPIHSLFCSMPLLCMLLELLLLHTPSCSSATANDDTLGAGQVLAVGDKLVSRNGKFALGFFQPAASVSTSKSISPNSSWYLGIWFNKIPVFTTVWVANRDKPATDPKLKITSQGNLVILDHASSESLIWSSTHIANRTQTSINTTTSALLLNSGNLALVESPSSKVLLWQSFDYPTDVALPGAKFGRNKLTGLKRPIKIGRASCRERVFRAV